MVELKEQINNLMNEFENQKLEIIEKENEIIMLGILEVNQIIFDEHILEKYELEIVITKDFPKRLPEIYEKNSRIKKHVNVDKTLCLGTEIELRMKLGKNPTLLHWLEKCVIPYLCVNRYDEKYETYPFGERSHGNDGIVQSYKELFETEKISVIKCFIEQILSGYRGHRLCPCGSKKKIRDCHKEMILKFIERSDLKEILKKDYKGGFQ